MRQPVDRVADHLDVGHVGRHRGPDPVHQRRSAGPPRPRRRPPPPAAPPPPPPPPAGRAPRRTPGLPLVGRPGRLPPGALAHHQQPDPGRPAPLVRAGGQHRPAGRHRRPADRLGGVDVAAAPRPRRTRRAASATGWTVPTSWLALISAASATPGAATAADQRVQVDPAEPVHRHRRRRAARRDVPLGGVQHRRVLDRRVHQGRRRPAPARPGRRARRRARPRAAGGEGHLVGADAERSATRPRGRRRAAAGPGGPACRAGRGRPSRRRARPAAPAGRPGAAARRWPRRGRPAAALTRANVSRRYAARSRPTGAGQRPPARSSPSWSSNLRPSVTPLPLGVLRATGQHRGALGRQDQVVARSSEVRPSAVRHSASQEPVGAGDVVPVGSPGSVSAERRCWSCSRAADVGDDVRRLRLAAGRHHARVAPDVRPVDRLGASPRSWSASSCGA